MFYFSLFIVFSLQLYVNAWENDDLELFDLVEEVNRNFYEALGVTQDASPAEIRKAYRKLSLQYHPDKNKEENAEEQFRQLVAMYEVLKDKDRRQQYDHVLEFGLPDWKQPVYYYRKVRKLGLIEMALMLFLIFTIGHFIVIWTIYFEHRFEREEVFKSRKKKEKKGRKAKANQEEEFEELLQEELDQVPKPRLILDLLPIKLVWGSISMVLGIPAWIARVKEEKEELRRQREAEEEERRLEEEEERLEQERKAMPRKRKVVTPPEASLCEFEKPVSYSLVQDVATDDIQQKEERTGPWTSEDDHLLAKAVARFPGGTSQRWEKIAEFVGRPENMVIKKAKSVRTDFKQVDAKSQGITGALGENVNMKKGLSINSEISTRNGGKEGEQNQLDSTYDQFNMYSGNPNLDSPNNKTKKKTKNSKSSDRTLLLSSPAVVNGVGSDESSSDKQQTGSSINNKSAKAKKKVNFNDTVESITTDALLKSNDDKLKVDNAEILSSVSKESSGSLVWSQNQQKIFEWGLNQFPKGTLERWEKMSEHIPGKTKEDCIVRFKYLAELVKKKRQEKQQQH